MWLSAPEARCPPSYRQGLSVSLHTTANTHWLQVWKCYVKLLFRILTWAIHCGITGKKKNLKEKHKKAWHTQIHHLTSGRLWGVRTKQRFLDMVIRNHPILSFIHHNVLPCQNHLGSFFQSTLGTASLRDVCSARIVVSFEQDFGVVKMVHGGILLLDCWVG